MDELMTMRANVSTSYCTGFKMRKWEEIAQVFNTYNNKKKFYTKFNLNKISILFNTSSVPEY